MVSESFGAAGLPVPSEHLEISQASSSHISAAAPQILGWLTEMIVRRTTSTVSSLPLKWKDDFPFPLLFKYPLSKALDPRNTGCPLSQQLIIMISATLSHSPFGLYVFLQYHFVSDPRPRSDQCPCANLLAHSATLREFATQASRFPFFSPCNVVCTLTWRWFVLGIAQAHTLFHSSCVESRWESAMHWILGNLSTRPPLAPRRFDPTLDNWMNSETNRSSPSNFDGMFGPSLTQYWVGENVGFCSWWLNCLISR